MDNLYEQWWERKLGGTYKDIHGNIHDAPTEDDFVNWMGNPYDVDRQYVRNLLPEYIETFLDVACGAAPEYIGLSEQKPYIKYTGVDITPRLVEYCNNKNINVQLGSAEDLPFEDSSFDAVHARHLLEHMSNFEKPISEFIRVAKEIVFVVFFICPQEGQSRITDITEMEDPCYDNVYDKIEIDNFISSNPKVSHHEWDFGHYGHSCAILQIEIE